MNKSLGAQITELTKAIEERDAQIAQATSDYNALAEESLRVSSEADDRIAEKQSEIEAVNTKMAALVEEHEAALAVINESLASVMAERDQAVESLTSAVAAKEHAQQALANPAFADAAARGVEPVTISSDAKERESIIDELNAIKDPKARQAFWREHKAELEDAQRNQ